MEWVDDHTMLYSSGSGVPGHVLAAQGKICFRTCFQRALLPVSYVLGLASVTYPAPGGEPRTFREAVDHWLLCEFLCAIGSHSMLWTLIWNTLSLRFSYITCLHISLCPFSSFVTGSSIPSTLCSFIYQVPFSLFPFYILSYGIDSHNIQLIL